MKVTTPVLLALVVGPVGWRWAGRRERRDALVVLAVPAVVLALALLPSDRDLGVRYLLPTFALWCVGAAPLLHLLRRGGAQLVAVLASAVAVGMLVASSPHALAYTSPPFTPGYRVASDSNVDWGQDFDDLRSWAVGLSPYVAWFGPRGTSWADVPGAKYLLGTDPTTITGWVAVSATTLTSGEIARATAVVVAGVLPGRHDRRLGAALPLRGAAHHRARSDGTCRPPAPAT